MPHPYQDIRYVEINNHTARPPLYNKLSNAGRREESTPKSVCYLTAISPSTDEQRQQAIAYYRKKLRADPLQFDAALNLGLLYYQSEEFIPAYACFEIAQKALPGNIQAIYYLGLSAMLLQDYSTALGHFLQVEKHDQFIELPLENRIDMQIYIGNIYLYLNRLDDAIDLFTHVSDETSHGQLTATHQLIHIYLNRQHNFAIAEHWIDLALALDPQSTTSIANKILVLKATGRLQEALPLLHKLVRLDPISSHAFYNLACLHAENKNEPLTREYLQKAIQFYPQAKNYAAHDMDFAPYFTAPWFTSLFQ